MFDLISIGDSMLDYFISLKEASVLTSKKQMHLNLCVSYADKVPAKSIDSQVAGNASNVATGATRLGLSTALYSVLGDDMAGQQIQAKMKREGVDTKYLITDKGKKNNYSFVLSYQGERTIIVYHEPRKYVMPKFDTTQWIYFTSLGNTDGKNKSFLQLNKNIVSYVRKNKISLAFNPGTFQLRMPKNLLIKIFQVSKVVFINVEEAMYVMGMKKNPGLKKLLETVSETGPQIVVITDGKNGSYCFDGKKYYHLGLFPAKIIDRTGAGDSYATAFIASLFYNNSITEAMRWGTINSASVVSTLGPQDGLLTKQQIFAKLQKNPKFQVQEI